MARSRSGGTLGCAAAIVLTSSTTRPVFEFIRIGSLIDKYRHLGYRRAPLSLIAGGRQGAEGPNRYQHLTPELRAPTMNLVATVQNAANEEGNWQTYLHSAQEACVRNSWGAPTC